MSNEPRKDSECDAVCRRLADMSRIAALHEVATGVLHNVGNVLNSVNISVNVLAENFRKSRCSDVAKLAELMGSHRDNLASFLSNDPKGRRVIDFVAQLAGRLAAERSAQAKELVLLQQNIAHIKDIVSIQQSCSRVSGITEIVQVPELVEDSIRLNTDAFFRNDVQVVRDFSEVPPVTIEKHKVLQILVNLIRNAKSACDEVTRPDKLVTVTVRHASDLVKVSVADNGIGIRPENLHRIFDHGFTTKKDGHGFGLHSGALAAKELGGSLFAASQGLNRGAVFTLELPVRPPR